MKYYAYFLRDFLLSLQMTRTNCYVGVLLNKLLYVGGLGHAAGLNRYNLTMSCASPVSSFACQWYSHVFIIKKKNWNVLMYLLFYNL